MKALSIRQPWAWLIAAGFKDIENRTWHTKFEGRIYIHAGKKTASHQSKVEALLTWGEAIRAAGIKPTDAEFEQWTSSILNLQNQGAIIGEVDIASCTHDSDSEWYAGPHGFVLRNPTLYKIPLPKSGRLGFFDVELP